MAHDEGLAEIVRQDLADEEVVEKRMFGGLCFMVRGHMTCLVSSDHAMVRVGRQGEAEALALPGTSRTTRPGRPMPGFIEVVPETMADDASRGRLIALALACNRDMPAK